MVPLRAVFEVLNCNVKWEDTSKSAVVEYGATKIIIPANSTTAYINGNASSLDVPAKIINDRIMIPLRFVSEAIEKQYLDEGRQDCINLLKLLIPKNLVGMPVEGARNSCPFRVSGSLVLLENNKRGPTFSEVGPLSQSFYLFNTSTAFLSWVSVSKYSIP